MSAGLSAYPRAHAFRSRHSFQTGLLLDADATQETVEEFVTGLFAQGIRAIRFEQMRADQDLRSLLRGVEERLGWRWFTDQTLQRAVWHTRHDALGALSKRRIKNMEKTSSACRRRWVRLSSA